MKNKKYPVGQYIIEGIGETDDAYEYVEDLLPLIGEVILFFNSLESDIDHLICEDISDRTDHKGLLVLHSMLYGTKVDLYERFKIEELRIFGWSLPGFKNLISQLRECGTLRNRVVHANWQYTNDEGYTHVRFKFGKNGLEHELTQFSVKSLEQIIQKIIDTRGAIEKFENELAGKHHEWQREIAERHGKCDT